MGTEKVARTVPLPKKVWVGTYEFPITVVPAEDPRLVDDSGDHCDGITDTDDATRGIYLSALLPRRTMLEIVLHELTHAIFDAYGIEDKAEEEVVARQLGIALSQVLLDNPKLQRWVTYTVNQIRKERKHA